MRQLFARCRSELARCGMRSCSFISRCVVCLVSPINSAKSDWDFKCLLWAFPLPSTYSPFFFQYSSRNLSIRETFIGSVSACPRLLFPEYFRLFPDNIRRAPLTRDPLGNSTLQIFGLIAPYLLSIDTENEMR